MVNSRIFRAEIEGSPESPKPADGEPSETEPVPLADPAGHTKHPRDVVKFKTSTPILS
jgi:hypothetical protein